MSPLAPRSADVARGTMPRSMRIPTDLWDAAVARARAEGTTVTAVVKLALREYVKR